MTENKTDRAELIARREKLADNVSSYIAAIAGFITNGEATAAIMADVDKYIADLLASQAKAEPAAWLIKSVAGNWYPISFDEAETMDYRNLPMKPLYLASSPAGSESAESTKLREALEPFAKLADWFDVEKARYGGLRNSGWPLAESDLRRARAALASTAGRSPDEKETPV